MKIYQILISTVVIIALAYFLPPLVLEHNESKLGADLEISTITEKIATIDEKVDAEKTTIDSIQATKLYEKGQYERINEYEKDGIKYKVVSYITPKNEKGYQIISWSDDFSRSIGYGADAEKHSWNIIKKYTATTTKTK